MNVISTRLCSATLAALIAAGVATAEEPFDSDLAVMQEEWAAANYEATEKHAREAAFAAVVEHAKSLAAQYPQRVEAVAWEGIVLSTYAGEVSALSAMKYAKAARAALHRAEKLDADALGGGIYASLGALYSKVPGGLMGFGDDRLAEEYFKKALAVDDGNIDSNYFYGEFLLEQGDATQAVGVLSRALDAPPVAGRPIFDAGRRAEIRALLEQAKRAAT
jgi:tetratricopeptide (TPR) repeat protein